MDVTSKVTDGIVKLSPFYPHGDIPLPFSQGYTATCVEAVWQYLGGQRDRYIGSLFRAAFVACSFC